MNAFVVIFGDQKTIETLVDCVSAMDMAIFVIL